MLQSDLLTMSCYKISLGSNRPHFMFVFETSKKPVGAAAVIMDSERRIKHNYGKYNWELPGGLSELNESAEETAKREVLEETGLEVTVGRLTGVYYEPDNDMHHLREGFLQGIVTRGESRRS